MRYVWSLFVALSVVGVSACAEAQPQSHPLDIQDSDRVMGAADAPVTVVEYASLTCAHCASFHEEKMPQIKAEYIDTGKVKFVLRDMPWDNIALAAAKIARCADDEQYYSYIDAFFGNVDTWARAQNPLVELKRIARLGGMSSEEVDSCLADTTLHQQILETKRVGLEVLGVQATPTVFVGKEASVSGNQSWDVFANAIDEALAQAN